MNKTVENNSKVQSSESAAGDQSANVGLIIGIIAAVVVILAILVFIIRKIVRGAQFKKDVRIEGKVVIITGANSGIGFHTAIDLARRGAKVYMACRDYQRCEEARRKIEDISGSTDVFNRTLDLSSIESIHNFAKAFLEEESRLDILINNAGIFAGPRTVTKDGFESQLGVNHLGHFLLTNLLLDLMKRSAPSRIVVVSSAFYKIGQINKDDLMGEEFYGRLDAYAQSKLANILFAHALSKKLEGTGVTVNSLHPGAINTEISQNLPRFFNIFSTPIKMLFFKTPQDGINTTLTVALDPDLEKTSGKYFSNCEVEEVSDKAKNDEVATWLWNKSEELTKLNSTPTTVSV